MIRASRGRAAVLLLLTFAAGLAVGIAGTIYALPDRDDEEHRDGRRGRTTIERFADELGITPDQKERIDPILVDTRERMSEVFDQVRPQWEAVVDSARAQIEAVLTEEQVRRYRELLERERGRNSEGDR